jgi:tetratricopeptide (TPR) repeat protein
VTQQGLDGDRPTEAFSALPVRALSRPRQTLVVAERVLADSTDPEERSYAGQARGIALRELGNVRAAVRQLRAAAKEAAEVDAAREADVTATLAVTLVVAGRSGEALERFQQALGKVSGAAAARIQVRHGSMLGELGRPIEAARELRAAVKTLRRVGDTTWEARALLNLAQAYIEVGDTWHAAGALVRAEQLLADPEQLFEAASARQDRGIVAILEGHIPEALGHFDVAEQRLAEAGNQSAELYERRADALLSAGLFADALASAEQAVAQLRRPGASAAQRAHALVRASDAALAVGKTEMALDYAREAGRLFRRQGRERGRTQARLSAAKAGVAAGDRSRRLLREAAAIATIAAQRRMAEAVEANLIAGELALQLGDVGSARQHLRRAGRARSNRSDVGKVLGWRAAALQAQAAGRRRAVLEACDSGLRVLQRHQLTFGGTETRAAATAHGLPLATMALREAVASDDPRSMLRWAERWRATAFNLPPVRTADDPELVTLLARMRLGRLRLAESTVAERTSAGLEREVAYLEEEIRRRTLRTSGASVGQVESLDIDNVLTELGDTRLLEIFTVDDVVHVLIATQAGIGHYAAGSYAAALRDAQFVQFTLRRTTHRVHGERARDRLPAVTAALERELLGDAVAELDDAPVVIVPPAALSSAPWSLLPSLQARVASVAPSVASWSVARRARPSTDSVTLVAGPGLKHARSEVETISRRYPNATVLGAGAARAEEVLAALDGAALAHVTAHGVFRNDNPMFSSIQLEDGPLTVLDLQRLSRAPYRLVLSCCDTGAMSTAGADEMLGVLSALIPLGTAGLLAAAVPVSDEAAVPFTALIHDRLSAGDTMAEALRIARTASSVDPALFAIAHSFLAFGAV